MKRTYRGSCHCKAVTFEADIDLANGTGKCNGTFCWKQRMWNVGRLKPAEFRLLSGEQDLTEYGKTGEWGEVHHCFCKHCGIATHGRSRIDQMGGELLFSVHLAALDDLPVEDLVAAPVQYMDGRHDNWQNPPQEKRHL
jgi:hypothetical protein